MIYRLDLVKSNYKTVCIYEEFITNGFKYGEAYETCEFFWDKFCRGDECNNEF